VPREDPHDPVAARTKPTKRQAKAAKRARRAAQRQTTADAAPPIHRLAPPPPPSQPHPEGRAPRAAWFDEARHWAEYVGVETDDGAFVVATADRHIGRGLLVKRSRPEFRVLRIAVMTLETMLGSDAVAGRTIVDVGANIGTTTVAALRSHGFGAAVACEPEEGNFRLLETNVALNGLASRAHMLQLGISSEAGRSTLVVHEESGGFSWIALDDERIAAAEAARAQTAAELALGDPPQTTTVEVEVTTLDRLAAEGVLDPDRLGLIWIDTEGHEGHVLKGAATLLERGVPVVMEVDPAYFEERGDADFVRALTTEHYTHFVDIRRRKEADGSPRLEVKRVSSLAEYAAQFDGGDRAAHTDVLLLRLDAVHLSRASTLAGLIKARRDRPGREDANAASNPGASRQARRKSRRTSGGREAGSSGSSDDSSAS
jgi:FkbM family methyltransferase